MTDPIRAKARIILRIRHPDRAPAAISAALGLEPDMAYGKGDQHHTPAGELVAFRHVQTLWSKTLIEFQDLPETATAVFVHLGRQLEKQATALADIRDSGGRAELFIGWFLHDNTGLSLSAETMGTFARLGVDLDFDVYPLAAEAE